MTSSEKSEFSEFRSQMKEELGGKREITLSGKVSTQLNRRVRGAIDGKKYATLNDIVEEAILEKIIKIEWDKVKNAGE